MVLSILIISLLILSSSFAYTWALQILSLYNINKHKQNKQRNEVPSLQHNKEASF